MRRRTVANAFPEVKDDEQGLRIMEMDSTGEETKETASDGPQTSVVTSLMSNNRALAAALEDAQLELRSINRENIQLRKQIHEDHHLFVEKTRDLEKQLRSLEQFSGNNLPKPAQVIFHDVYNLLKETCTQFLQGSNFLSDALHLVNSLLTQSNGLVKVEDVSTHKYVHALFNQVSPYVDPVVSTACTTPPPDDLANPACTTPPPDEPSSMEITTSQDVTIETFDTALRPSHREHGKIGDDLAAMDIDQLQVENRRCSKRKSSMGVSYTEPTLNSKLRRGDRFTDTTFCEDGVFWETRKKKKAQSKRQASLTLCGRTKKRAPLTDLTNVIKEEPWF
ncbi:uncharacterized protein [Montipora capricornis]